MQDGMYTTFTVPTTELFVLLEVDTYYEHPTKLEVYLHIYSKCVLCIVSLMLIY